jgi:hypothetical protein
MSPLNETVIGFGGGGGVGDALGVGLALVLFFPAAWAPAEAAD